jgi:hypothetical protein
MPCNSSRMLILADGRGSALHLVGSARGDSIQLPVLRNHGGSHGRYANKPADDRSHPWWQVPQNLTFEQAAAFWLEHGQARVYL